MLTGAQAAHGGTPPPRSPTSTCTRTCRPPSAAVPGLPRTSTRWSPAPPPATADRRPADARVLLHQVHRVRQALDEGVPEDPELVADLAPPIAVVVLEPELDDHDTERADEQALADAAAAPYDHDQDVREDTDPLERYSDTSSIERREAALVPRASPPPPAVTDPWENRRPRRSRRGPVLLLARAAAGRRRRRGRVVLRVRALHQHPRRHRAHRGPGRSPDGQVGAGLRGQGHGVLRAPCRPAR